MLEYCPPPDNKVLPCEIVQPTGVVALTEPDIRTQTSRGELKEINWDEHIPPARMNEDTRLKLIDLLPFHQPVFRVDMTELGCVPDFYYKIELKPGAKVVHQRPYRTIPENEAEIEKQVQTLIDLGVIFYSDSHWTSGVILVKKKVDKPGENRVNVSYIDLRHLNEQVMQDSWPILTTESIIQHIGLGGGKQLTCLDLQGAYFHIKVLPCSQHLLMFVTTNSAYKFNCLPFRLTSAPVSFCSVI